MEPIRNDSPPPTPPPAASEESYQTMKLIQKLATTTLETEFAQPIDWKNARIHTPGDVVAVKDEHKNKAFVNRSGTHAATLYTHIAGHSQGLIHTDGRTAAASVTTSIPKPPPRPTGAGSTFVQFDKYKLDNMDKDFYAPEIAQNNKIFYSGCHLIDYQFTSGAAHTDANNYFPGNYFYNTPIKNWLVDPFRTSAYVEIPVYTSHPPIIRAKRGQGDFPIPIALFFIQIGSVKQQAYPQGKEKFPITIYCFPNNSYDYENAKKYLNLTEYFAESMVPHFQLNPALYFLLKPAIIHTLHSKQLEKEKEMAEFIQDLFGHTQNNAVIAELAGQVIDNEIESSLLLPECAPIRDAALDEAMDHVGEFLIQHGLNNVLKAETLSLTARLSFIDSIIEHIEDFETATLVESAFFKTLQRQMQEVLTELRTLGPTLQIDELLQLSAIELKLTSYFTLPMALQGGTLCNEEQFCHHFGKAMDTLKLLVDMLPDTFSPQQMVSFLQRLYNAEETLRSLTALGLGDQFTQESDFLYECRDVCKDIFLELDDKTRASLPPEWTEQYFQSLGREPEDEEEF